MSILDNLSPVDFEDLCRDLLYKELGVRFSAFGPGADNGIDGRHAKGTEAIVLQCKHYSGSTFSQLKTSLKKEIQKINKLQPRRYLLLTSQSLTPKKSNELSEILGKRLANLGDIWGEEDILAALRNHPTVEKSHIKLWLSSTAVLERILHSGLEAFTNSTQEEILDELKVYVRNPSFEIATERIENENILIISGPPGVGKTTLAKMVSYQYLNDGWKFCAISSLDDGFRMINDSIPTIYYFDDFLGRVELDRQSMLRSDSALATFVKRIRKSKNARFILTSRAHIFEEARRISDYIDDPSLQLAKYVLDVGVYTRRIRSLILFNHLSVSYLTKEHFEKLVEGDWLKKIVDHRNYNPRVISSISSHSLEMYEPSEYPKRILNALENPDLIWSKPFRTLDLKSQNLITTLYFCDQYGMKIDDLRTIFIAVHHTICASHSQPTKPTDFEETLRSLESGFITISGQMVQYVNPSLRDFMKSYLIEKELLKLLPRTSIQAGWAKQLWLHIKIVYKAHPEFLEIIIREFRGLLRQDDSCKAEKITSTLNSDSLSNCAWIELLLEWGMVSGDNTFILYALCVLNDDSIDWDAIYDGDELPELHYNIRHSMEDDRELQSALLLSVDKRMSEILDQHILLETLSTIADKVYEYMGDEVSEETTSKLDSLIDYEFNQTAHSIDHFSTKAELDDHLEHLESLAAVTGHSIESARSVVQDRIHETVEEENDEKVISFTSSHSSINEKFSDADLRSLFCSLIA